MAQPERILLAGMMGSGKSSVGAILAARLGRPFVDLDAWVVEQAGRSITEIFAVEGEAGFRARERAALADAYGEDPDARSHGETFLEVLKRRLQPPGLFFLDEPETPLSPTRQLALLSLLKSCAEAGGQFVIATHSPILMALPGAAILLIEGGAIRDVAWEEVEHVSLTRAFLTNPESFLRHL